jgi:hypothetical protein
VLAFITLVAGIIVVSLIIGKVLAPISRAQQKGVDRMRAHKEIEYNKVYAAEMEAEAAKDAKRHPQPPPSVPAGWYPDPNNAQLQRYWDGTSWTNSTT